MARIVLVVDDAEKELWVKQAHSELTTLSEWIRRAGRERVQGKSYISSAPVMVKVSPEQLTGVEWIPARAEEYAEAAVEDPVLPPPQPGTAMQESADSESPSTAPLCRRHKIHHVYHAGRPCPLCNYPKEG
jgi:hypothetical protein